MTLPTLFRDALRSAIPSALPTQTLDRLDRLAVRDAVTGALVQRLLATPADGTLSAERDELADWLGAESLAYLHLHETELALAVDADLHTSVAWLSGALFSAMDQGRAAA